MGYLQTTDQGSIHEGPNLAAAQKSERTPSLTASGRISKRADVRSIEKLDRVTLSPAADALAQTSYGVDSARAERLDVLREAIKASSLPIYPKAIAEAIWREEGANSGAQIPDVAGLAEPE